MLGADWAGLVQETRPKPRRLDGCGSAHRRWKLKTLISNLGVLSKYAGKEFAEQLITDEVSFSAGLEGAENKFGEFFLEIIIWMNFGFLFNLDCLFNVHQTFFW